MAVVTAGALAASWRWLVKRLPPWTIATAAVVFVGAVTAGAWLDASGVGARHGYVVNVVSSLTGFALALPVAAVALPAIQARARLRSEATVWWRVAERRYRQVVDLSESLLHDVIGELRVGDIPVFEGAEFDLALARRFLWGDAPAYRVADIARFDAATLAWQERMQAVVSALIPAVENAPFADEIIGHARVLDESAWISRLLEFRDDPEDKPDPFRLSVTGYMWLSQEVELLVGLRDALRTLADLVAPPPPGPPPKPRWTLRERLARRH